MTNEELKRGTYRILVWSLTAGAICALGALAIERAVAEGVMLGAGSSALGLWLMQRRLRTIGGIPADRLQRTIYEWMAVRMVIYAAAFGTAYWIDRIHTYGLIGAVGGMLAFRTTFIALTLYQQRRFRRRPSG